MNIIFQLVTILAVSGIFLSGCVSQKDSLVKDGYPVAYADGFDDGCHSGKKAAGNMFEHFKKDTRRFEYDSQYGQGWSDGFRQCESEEESLERQIRIGMEQQKYLEQKRKYDWQEQRHLEHQALKGVDTSNFKYLK